MGPHLTDASIKAYLGEMRARLERGLEIAKLAEACANAGSAEKGIELALDLEEIVVEVNTLLNAASLLCRLAKD